MTNEKMKQILDDLEIANCNLKYLIDKIRYGHKNEPEAKAVIIETTKLMERAKKNIEDGKL